MIKWFKELIKNEKINIKNDNVKIKMNMNILK